VDRVRKQDLTSCSISKRVASHSPKSLADEAPNFESRCSRRCDGMSPAEIIEEKILFARDPLRERYAEMRQQLEDAAAGREVAMTSPVWGA
jgi:hypothetical protein